MISSKDTNGKLEQIYLTHFWDPDYGSSTLFNIYKRKKVYQIASTIAIKDGKIINTNNSNISRVNSNGNLHNTINRWNPYQVGTIASITNQTQDSEPVKVAAGGGNGTAPLTIFTPEEVEIKAGQSVTWHNPTTVGEPHTVTFIFDGNKSAGVVSPLGVSNSTEFSALPPGSNNEPIIIPGVDGLNTIIAVNARTFNPVVIDSSENVNFMAPNAHYTLTGAEKYVNSGWFLPDGFEKEYPGAGNTFSVTFENPGSYHYICILHPWMTGTVKVS